MVTAAGDIVELVVQFTTIRPDLLALLCGSEGMLGIVTEVTVALLPSPETKTVLLAAFSQVVDAGNAVAAIIVAGIIPADGMMDKMAVQQRGLCQGRVSAGCRSHFNHRTDGADAELAT